MRFLYPERIDHSEPEYILDDENPYVLRRAQGPYDPRWQRGSVVYPLADYPTIPRTSDREVRVGTPHDPNNGQERVRIRGPDGRDAIPLRELRKFGTSVGLAHDPDDDAWDAPHVLHDLLDHYDRSRVPTHIRSRALRPRLLDLIESNRSANSLTLEALIVPTNSRWAGFDLRGVFQNIPVTPLQVQILAKVCSGELDDAGSYTLPIQGTKIGIIEVAMYEQHGAQRHYDAIRVDDHVYLRRHLQAGDICFRITFSPQTERTSYKTNASRETRHTIDHLARILISNLAGTS